MKKNIILIFVLIIFSLPSVFSLLSKGFFQSDDAEWMTIRFSAFYQELSNGQFPVRFLNRLNHGYGYPVTNFLYPGFMYLGVPIHLLGFGFVSTIKIIFGLSMIGSAVFCFLWLSKLFGKLPSFIGSLFYLYTPYHLFDLYKRGSVGEVLALAVLPFVLWQIERKSFFWTSIGIAFLILSHNTLAILFLPIIIIYIFYKKYSILNTLYLILFGLGLSAFFWIPAIFELKYTIFSQTQVSEWQNYFADISLIGLSTIFILILTSVFKKNRLTLLLFVASLVSVFLSSSLSATLWNILPVSFIQFPFRFLSLTIVCISFLAAYILYVSPKRLKIPIAVLGLVFLIFSAKPFLTPSQFFDKGEGFYATNEGTTTVRSEYMQIWVKNLPTEHFKEKVEIENGDIKNLDISSGNINFIASTATDTVATINTIYYPGWKAKVDDKSVEISYENERGVMEIPIPKGEHMVKVTFTEPPLRLISNIISLLSFFAILFIGIKGFRNTR